MLDRTKLISYADHMDAFADSTADPAGTRAQAKRFREDTEFEHLWDTEKEIWHIIRKPSG